MQPIERSETVSQAELGDALGLAPAAGVLAHGFLRWLECAGVDTRRPIVRHRPKEVLVAVI